MLDTACTKQAQGFGLAAGTSPSLPHRPVLLSLRCRALWEGLPNIPAPPFKLESSFHPPDAWLSLRRVILVAQSLNVFAKFLLIL